MEDLTLILKRKNVVPKKKEKKVLTDISHEEIQENKRIIEQAETFWRQLDDFRVRALRNFYYMIGKQWSDQLYITYKNGKTETLTEEQYIRNQGRIPFVQNYIANVIRNIIGQYRAGSQKTRVISTKKEDLPKSEMLTMALESALKMNKADEILDPRLLEQFLSCGLIPQRVDYKWWPEKNREDLYLENVSPYRIFFNTGISDPRMIDIDFIGEFRDTSIENIVSAFAKTKEQEKQIRDIYKVNKYYYKGEAAEYTGSGEENSDLDFYVPQDGSLCRLYVIWMKMADWRTYEHDYLYATYKCTTRTPEEIEAVNAERIQFGIDNGVNPENIPLIEYERKYEQYWYYKYLSPEGYCFAEGESFYEHESHPYVIAGHPMFNGRIFGFVETLIDQQRYINRLLSLYDGMIGASAKGVLLVPEDVIPDDMDIEDFAEEWTKFNGVIKIKLKAGAQVPQQISGSVANVGIQEMLSFTLKMFFDTSGVNQSIQGQRAPSGTPSSLYAQEAQNSILNIKDIIDHFYSFKKDRDLKALRVIRQFYKEDRILTVTGNNYQSEISEYKVSEARAMKDIDVDMSPIVNTPMFMQAAEDMLKELFMARAISVKNYLSNSTQPFAQKLLTDIEKEEQQFQNTGQLSPEMMGQMQNQTPNEGIMRQALGVR